nr:E3 ubiquitin-protein ligase ZSWIM2 isoform X2 [Anser cygnoides]XP_047914274.1 E3 ubiquitin-protein ligase ZSWIM2 isoform X2 [Anser cygnoides]
MFSEPFSSQKARDKPGGFQARRKRINASKLGLLEREIEEILERLHQKPTQNAKQTLFSQTAHEENDRCIHQKEIDEKDVCPICQEELLKKMLPITYCRYSCGNNVHVKCMKIWADHQDETEKDSVVKCPLCREKFAPLELIPEEFRNSDQLVTATEKARLDRHLGIPCSNCRVFPIVGKCYKTTCNPKNIVKSLPVILVSKHSNLLAPGIQCRLFEELSSWSVCKTPTM